MKKTFIILLLLSASLLLYGLFTVAVSSYQAWPTQTPPKAMPRPEHCYAQASGGISRETAAFKTSSVSDSENLSRDVQQLHQFAKGSLRPNQKIPEYAPLFGSIDAFDGTRLSYGSYLPDEPKAALIFYHGSGANGEAGYTYMAEQLSRKYNIATYLFDIRGHGRSGGARGDAPMPSTVWSDVCNALHFVQTEHPGLPVFLGGHSGGAGLLINYAAWSGHEQPEGYFFVTPMLGRDAHVVRDRQQKSRHPFVTVNRFALFMYHITGGLIGGHWHAVHFNYPDHLVNERGFVRDYTVNMVEAIHPHNASDVLSLIKVPLYIFIADRDELFDPVKMDTFLTPSLQSNHQMKVIHLPESYHLGVLGDVHDQLGSALHEACFS